MKDILSSDRNLNKTARVTFLLSPALKTALQSLCRDRSITLSELIVSSIIDFVGRQYPEFENHYNLSKSNNS